MSARRERAGQKLSFRTLLLIAVACTAGVLLICALLILRSGRQISNHYVEGVGAETLKYYQLTLDHTLEAIDEYWGANFEDGSTAPLFQTEDPAQGAALRNAIGEQLQTLTQTHRLAVAQSGQQALPVQCQAAAGILYRRDAELAHSLQSERRAGGPVSVLRRSWKIHRRRR